MNLNSLQQHFKDSILTSFQYEAEGKEYLACRFVRDGYNYRGRKAKLTPKKKGLFVTFWKRNKEGITEPHHATDDFEYLLINVQKDSQSGYYLFSKEVLIQRGVVSTNTAEGKRGFRIYPPWDAVDNKTAKKSQEWQNEYFIATP